jgi:hypothetical protein
MNGHIYNMFTTKWVTNIPTWILLHICPYYNNLWLTLLISTANKFQSQQPTCWLRSCPRARDCEWRLKLYTQGYVIRLCWASVLPSLVGHPLTVWNFDRNFRAKTVNTCIRRNKATIIFVLFPPTFSYFHTIFQLLPFLFHCFSYFSETKLGRSGISVTVFTPRGAGFFHDHERAAGRVQSEKVFTGWQWAWWRHPWVSVSLSRAL